MVADPDANASEMERRITALTAQVQTLQDNMSISVERSNTELGKLQRDVKK